MILQVAIGIVLGYIILALLPVVFTKGFWEIIGGIVGIGLIIIALIIFVANIDALVPYVWIGGVVLMVAAFYSEREYVKKYSKIKFTIDEQKASVIVEGQNNEVIATYTGIRNHVSAAQRFFEEKKLNLDDYSVRVLKKKGNTYSCIYTRKQKKQK